MRNFTRYKIIRYLAFLLVLQSLLFAQSGWVQQTSGINKTLNTGFIINDNTGYAAGNSGVILKTVNGGSNWIVVYNQTIYDILAVSFSNASTGWAFMKGNVNDSSFVIKTTNSGSSWIKNFVDTGSFQNDLAGLQFTGANTGYLANSHGLRKSVNGGSGWTYLNSGVTLPTCLSFINESTGWVAGYQTTLFKTTDSGQNWLQQFNSQPSTNSRAVVFMNSLTGFYATDYAVYRTSNGGSDWFESFNVGNIYPRSVSFINANTGWVLALTADTSFRNIILRTDNSGVTWGIHELILPSKRFNRVYFTSQNTGWLLGDSGYIYKTTNGGFPIGIQLISNEIPQDFLLSQNYPNPFNPSTIIRFDVSGTSSAKTSLIVYDLLGQEVATLVNENLRPGEYDVQFDGTNNPSGIYYYKLTAGNFTETKKMVLVK
jgi:photosystem II stability/assembly factor-like uncharacterized protein